MKTILQIAALMFLSSLAWGQSATSSTIINGQNASNTTTIDGHTYVTNCSFGSIASRCDTHEEVEPSLWQQIKAAHAQNKFCKDHGIKHPVLSAKEQKERRKDGDNAVFTDECQQAWETR